MGISCHQAFSYYFHSANLCNPHAKISAALKLKYPPMLAAIKYLYKFLKFSSICAISIIVALMVHIASKECVVNLLTKLSKF